MINLKNVSARRLAVNIVEKMPTILGCLFFLFSFILPFYSTYLMTTAGGGPIYYWSFEAESHLSGPPPGYVVSTQYRFSNYWFNYFPTLNLGWTLTLLFTIQALTLFFGIAYIFVNRRVLSIAPILLCSVVIALMIYASITLSASAPSYLYGDYEQGYYLIYPSVVMFLLALLRGEMTKRQQMPKRYALKNV